jgi:hypothetical protein
MSKNKVVKPVGFNITNPNDVKILDHVKRRNFSGYVKKLILADILKGDEFKAENEPLEAVKTDEQKMNRLEKLKAAQERAANKLQP